MPGLVYWGLTHQQQPGSYRGSDDDDGDGDGGDDGGDDDGDDDDDALTHRATEPPYNICLR